jgi:hypothetical protein
MIEIDSSPVENYPSDAELRFMWKQESDAEIASLKSNLRKQRETIFFLERDKDVLTQNIQNLTTFN